MSEMRMKLLSRKKQKKLADYIKESFKGKGLSEEAAELIAWETVYKESRDRRKEWARLQKQEE